MYKIIYSYNTHLLEGIGKETIKACDHVKNSSTVFFLYMNVCVDFNVNDLSTIFKLAGLCRLSPVSLPTRHRLSKCHFRAGACSVVLGASGW